MEVEVEVESIALSAAAAALARMTRVIVKSKARQGKARIWMPCYSFWIFMF